jgi:hypothetical protein
MSSALTSYSLMVNSALYSVSHVDVDTGVKNLRGFTPLEMLLNNDRDVSLVHILNREAEGL